MTSLDDVTANIRLGGSIQSCELSTYSKYIFTLRFALGPRSLKFFRLLLTVIGFGTLYLIPINRSNPILRNYGKVFTK